jgi:hypothetical protein
MSIIPNFTLLALLALLILVTWFVINDDDCE